MFQKIKVANQKEELVIEEKIKNIIITGKNGAGKSFFLKGLENNLTQNIGHGTAFLLPKSLGEITSLKKGHSIVPFNKQEALNDNVFSMDAAINSLKLERELDAHKNDLKQMFATTHPLKQWSMEIGYNYNNPQPFAPILNLNQLINNEIQNQYTHLNSRVSKFFNELSADLVEGLVQNNGQINEGDMNEKYPFIRLKNAMELFLEGKKIKTVHDQSRKIMIEDVNGEVVEANLSLSDGEKRIFALASLLLENEEKQKCIAYTWDEPENHLSPSWQRKIIPFLNMVSPDTQFVLATHSTEILKSMHQRKNTIITSLTRDVNGIDLKETNIFDDEQILGEMGWSESELQKILSSKKPILLLEGKTDEKYIRTLDVSKNFWVISVKGDGRMRSAVDVLPFLINHPILGLCDKDVNFNCINKPFLKTDFLPGLDSGEAIEKSFEDTIKSISNDEESTSLITGDNINEYEQKILFRATEKPVPTEAIQQIIHKQGFVDSNKFKLNNGEHLWSKQKLCDFLTENHKDKVKESLQKTEKYLKNYLQEIENVFPSKPQE